LGRPPPPLSSLALWSKKEKQRRDRVKPLMQKVSRQGIGTLTAKPLLDIEKGVEKPKDFTNPYGEKSRNALNKV
jgi:hypothetical protein